ncbi:putative FlgJ-like protein [Legionella lansingensis]|uniref:Putative FlgJ-like protein n=1 Tax=Legionella lansingensis TaxID=45067 RepID=A0A0W0VPV6_9GAMM|nr:hypothetical protein [Legionella lansingensis]KTD22047.1 putative FlgJ-like protein [Legionella lansingensis]SNV54130.1 putative FlgJ-like protein [Legionella lansingensis]
MNVRPHPQFLELLFTARGKIFSVFNDVLGLHDTNHIAITRITEAGEILAFSSTPALEFNLFKDKLWSFDQMYTPSWFLSGKHSEWSTLYTPERYDELYYIKQIKHQYPIAYSLGTTIDGTNFIYSFASKGYSEHLHQVFREQIENIHQIGEYCVNRLSTLFPT